jgi:hypothetical protein
MEAAARTVRPHETLNIMKIPEDWNKGWWLMQRLEQAGFGGKVAVKSVEGRREAESLEVLVGNLMVSKDMFFPGWSEEELERLEKVLLDEVEKSDAYMTWEGGVGLKMTAWVGYAWK